MEEISRIDQTIKVDETTYLLGMVNILEILQTDLKIFLENENRMYGIMKSYMDSIDDVLEKLNEIPGIENKEDDFGRILFLYRKVIKSEYKRLRFKKRLSEGDSTMIIMKKIVELISGYPGFILNKELRTLRKILGKIIDNIKNKNKNDKLYLLSDKINTYLPQGIIGKCKCIRFSLIQQEKSNNSEEEENKELINNSINQITEITWKG